MFLSDSRRVATWGFGQSGRVLREVRPSSDRTVEVVSTNPAGSVAAGFAAGDLIVALNGRIVTNVDELHRLLTGLAHEEAVVITLVRDREKQEVMVRLGMVG